MAQVTERGPLAIRRRIFEEFEKVKTQIATNAELWSILSFEAHKDLCKVLGEDFMNYLEFEFWFSRFARGNFELDYDRSSDPKARSLTDLPLEVFEIVAENLELEDRLQLGNVCKDIRFQVDNWDLKLDELWYGGANHWVFDLNSKPHCPRSIGEDENNRFRSAFTRNPVSFVMNILRLPKLQLEKLEIQEQDEYWEKLIKRLDESNRKLHVKNVEFLFHYNPPKVDLHFLIPGVLEKIKMFLASPTRKELYKIVESEQCQSAEIVHIESRMVTSRFPLDLLSYCPRFTLRLDGSADSLKANFLKKLMKCGEVEKCVLYILGPYDIRDNPCQILKYFNEPEAMVPDSPMLRRYPIPGTNEFYEIEYREELDYREEVVCLERKQ